MAIRVSKTYAFNDDKSKREIVIIHGDEVTVPSGNNASSISINASSLELSSYLSRYAVISAEAMYYGSGSTAWYNTLDGSVANGQAMITTRVGSSDLTVYLWNRTTSSKSMTYRIVLMEVGS